MRGNDAIDVNKMHSNAREQGAPMHEKLSPGRRQGFVPGLKQLRCGAIAQQAVSLLDRASYAESSLAY